MNHKNVLKLFLLFAVTLYLTGCQKDEVISPLPEPGYPTIYKTLTQSEWAEKNAEFQEINSYDGLSLNEYGFVEGEIQFNDEDSITEEFVTGLLEYIFETYGTYLGIINNINVENDIRTVFPFLVGGGSITLKEYFEELNATKEHEYWSEISDEFENQLFFITQKTIGNKNFAGPTIYFNFSKTDKTIYLAGNWFPEAYIPKEEIFTLDEAVPLSYKLTLDETGYDFWESKNTFEATKIFALKEKENEFSIHECWKFKITIEQKGYFYYIFIDTQTGEVIYNYKRSMYYI